jgi:hypothetical protein
MGATLAGQLSSRGGAGYRAHPQGARATEARDAKTGPGSDQACEEAGGSSSRSQKAADAEDQLPNRALVRRGGPKDERGAELSPGLMARWRPAAGPASMGKPRSRTHEACFTGRTAAGVS